MPQPIVHPHFVFRRGPAWQIAGGRRGFTLIEILVVVVILGLAAAIIVPQLNSRSDQVAASGARQLMADLLFAQSRAVATQKKHYIQFNVSGSSYSILDSLTPQDIVTHPVLQTPYQIVFNSGNLSGLTIGSASFDAQSTLAFDELGAPYSYNAVTSTLTPLNAGTITLKCGTYTTTLTVMPFSGEIKIQ